MDASDAPVDALPGDLLHLLLTACAPFKPALRAVCRRWRRACAAVPGRPDSLYGLAKRGHQGLLVWIYELRRFRISAHHACCVLAGAARGGHAELAVLAKEWGGHDFNRMLAAAAQGGHEALAAMAVEWGATNFDHMAYAAGRAGDELMAHMAREWGQEHFGDDGFGPDAMLRGAAAGGHEALLVLAHQWGAEDFGGMAGQAARAGHEDAVHLAFEWAGAAGRPVLAERTLIGAVRGGHERLARLAKKWGAKYYALALVVAARHGRLRLATLLKEWLAELSVEFHPETRAADLLRPILPRAFRAACRGGHAAMVRQVGAWTVELLERPAPDGPGDSGDSGDDSGDDSGGWGNSDGGSSASDDSSGMGD